MSAGRLQEHYGQITLHSFVKFCRNADCRHSGKLPAKPLYLIKDVIIRKNAGRAGAGGHGILRFRESVRDRALSDIDVTISPGG